MKKQIKIKLHVASQTIRNIGDTDYKLVRGAGIEWPTEPKDTSKNCCASTL